MPAAALCKFKKTGNYVAEKDAEGSKPSALLLKNRDWWGWGVYEESESHFS